MDEEFLEVNFKRPKSKYHLKAVLRPCPVCGERMKDVLGHYACGYANHWVYHEDGTLADNVNKPCKRGPYEIAKQNVIDCLDKQELANRKLRNKKRNPRVIDRSLDQELNRLLDILIEENVKRRRDP